MATHSIALTEFHEQPIHLFHEVGTVLRDKDGNDWTRTAYGRWCLLSDDLDQHEHSAQCGCPWTRIVVRSPFLLFFLPNQAFTSGSEWEPVVSEDVLVGDEIEAALKWDTGSVRFTGTVTGVDHALTAATSRPYFTLEGRDLCPFYYGGLDIRRRKRPMPEPGPGPGAVVEVAGYRIGRGDHGGPDPLACSDGEPH
ncbi:MAG: hypothetical protein ACRERU_00750 [Methylococcales bacterium]